MTTPVVSVGEHTTIPEVAGLLVRHAIKRVPVVHDGKLVGIISRADVVRALVRQPEELATDRF